MLKAKMYIIVQLEIKLPTGTLPSIIIIPATNNNDASKFLARNALNDAEATKKASKANIVADNGEKMYLNIHWNKLPSVCTCAPQSTGTTTSDDPEFKIAASAAF